MAVTVVESPEQSSATDAREAESSKHDAEDLQAQIRAADAAEKQVMSAWLAALLSGLGTVLIVWTLFETRRAVYVSHHAERAFLYLESTLSKGSKELVVKVRNRGRTPANVLGCKILPVATLPAAKKGFKDLTSFELSMPMQIGEVGDVTAIRDGAQPATPAFRVEILYMDVFNRKCRTIGFYEARRGKWELVSNTGWLHMT